MIEQVALLATLKPLVTTLEASITERSLATPEVAEHLEQEHRKAVTAKRTAMSLEEWREGEITQSAVAWVLACVFVRFLEDNGLIDQPLISGPAARRAAALGHREEHFRAHPEHSDREYLEACFREVARFPAVSALYDEQHNPLWRLGPTADGAGGLREAFTAIDPDSGLLVHDFCDPELGTRFLGDLYQDLSETAKKRYALLQTPDFVARFILDRTLTPALDEFGLDETRLIDPTCGSGHFLIDAFERMFALWQDREPGTDRAVLAQRCLERIAGVDLNPYATAIARFRLIMAALKACGIRRLAEVPAFTPHLATGDSLLHGPLPGEGATMLFDANRLNRNIAHVFESEDAAELKQILGRGYHAVVGNPPYIAVKDPVLRAAIKTRYACCSGQWVLTVPFMERFVELAVTTAGPGYVGKVTGSAFSKREFGKKLIREHFRAWNVTAVYDVSGVHLPGHGTDVVMIFGKAERPKTDAVLFGLKEAGDPAAAATSPAWSELVTHADDTGYRGTYFSISAVSRSRLSEHPWKFGSSGAQEVLALLQRASTRLASSVVADFGFGAISGADPVFFAPSDELSPDRSSWQAAVEGDDVRDWSIRQGRALITFEGPEADSRWPVDYADQVRLWRARPVLARRLRFGTPMLDGGSDWFAWRETYPSKLDARRAIVFGEITTRNQFGRRSAGVVTTQTAPLAAFGDRATSDDQFNLLEFLNSSTACFYYMQVCAKKGANTSKKRTRDERFVFNARSVAETPLPPSSSGALARHLERVADHRSAVARRGLAEHGSRSLFDVAEELEQADAVVLGRMRFLQEEIDWTTYERCGLTDLSPLDFVDVPVVLPGQRAFEVLAARQDPPSADMQMWFERDLIAASPLIPKAWPQPYQALVERRIKAIEESSVLEVLEAPKHKRRWLMRSATDELRGLAAEAVARTLEALPIWGDGRLHSPGELADVARHDEQLMDRLRFAGNDKIGELTDVCDAFLRQAAVDEPAAALYSETGLVKHLIWRRAWDEQRVAETRLGLPPWEPHAACPVHEAREAGFFASFCPPEFKPADYAIRKGWAVRGKLDMPNERFHRLAHSNGPAVYGLASWTALERARGIATYVVEQRTSASPEESELVPPLTAVLELLPWIHQWHPEIDTLYGGQPGRYFEGWLDGQLAELAITRETLRTWRPPPPTRGRKAKGTSA